MKRVRLLIGALLAFVLAAPAAAQPASGAAPITSVINAPGPAASAPDGPPAEDGDDEGPTAAERADPWQPFNRAMFKVNEELDQGLLFPLASAYVGLVPELVRIGIGNVFANAQDLWSAVNNLLQGKFQRSVEMTMRFATNSTFGAFGLIDIATAVGMERSPEDFGQTLGRWGFGAGAYLVIPVLGPSSVRDTVALPLDVSASPAWLINDGSTKLGVAAISLVNTRASLLGATNVIDEISLDKYTFIRDAYLQRRRSLVFDGDVPEEPDQQGAGGPASGAATEVGGAASAPQPAASAAPPGASAPEPRRP